MRLPMAVLNLGYIEVTRDDRLDGPHDDRGVVARVYYGTNWLIENPGADPREAPLIDGTFVNGGRGFCLEVTNRSGQGMDLVIVGPRGVLRMRAEHGVTMQAAELAKQGIRTRGDASDIRLE